MSRRSRSPRRRLQDDDYSRPSSGSSYRSRGDRDYESRYRESGPSRRDKDRGQRPEDDRPRRERRDYDEKDREREREKDRNRYDKRDRDDGYGSSRRSRRSASPRSRGSKPPGERSKSRSGSPVPVDKAKPNFAPSGLLAAETNTVKAVDGTSTVLKYNEPPEARKPVLGWRLYIFKDEEQSGTQRFLGVSIALCADSTVARGAVSEPLHIQRQSAYLFGRDRLVADIALDHPSCSKQHAAIQCRLCLPYGGCN